MADQSKVLQQSSGAKDLVLELLVGTRKKKLISSAILLIIAFLIHIKSSTPSQELKMNLKEKGKDKKVTLIFIVGRQGTCRRHIFQQN